MTDGADTESVDQFACEFCGKPQLELYEGWFRTAAAKNPYAAGTASAGVIQLRRACRSCAKLLIDSGMACAESLPAND